jgi:hypothetical protein
MPLRTMLLIREIVLSECCRISLSRISATVAPISVFDQKLTFSWLQVSGFSSPRGNGLMIQLCDCCS